MRTSTFEEGRLYVSDPTAISPSVTRSTHDFCRCEIGGAVFAFSWLCVLCAVP